MIASKRGWGVEIVILYTSSACLPCVRGLREWRGTAEMEQFVSLVVFFWPLRRGCDLFYGIGRVRINHSNLVWISINVIDFFLVSVWFLLEMFCKDDFNEECLKWDLWKTGIIFLKWILLINFWYQPLCPFSPIIVMIITKIIIIVSILTQK